MMLSNLKWLLFFITAVMIMPLDGFAKTEHLVYFENTDYELHIYKIYGAEENGTLMIIGGIQGDEPGGYLAADLYADMALQKGNLIVVPRANFLSIIKNKRSINNDMNRRFIKKHSREDYEDRIVEILKGLIAESNYLLNLHEGSGFYSDAWKSDLVNPKRFGQSIIADADIYRGKDGKEIHLGMIAKVIVEKVNVSIINKNHHFKFNNHRTFEKDTIHQEQRKSATFYALSKHNIPAFGIETSKEIKNIEKKVRYQTLVINAFMQEFGIVPENPKVALDAPLLNYIVVSVNGLNTFLHNGERLKVRRGDKVKIVNIDANYKRGLSVDINGVGTANDLNKEFVVKSPLRVIARKDRLKCGEVRFDVVDSRDTIKFKYLILEHNYTKYVLTDREHLKVVRGDVIRLLDVVVDGISASELVVNFLGFVGNKLNNTGEDRGYTINTAKDLWIKYSKDRKGKNYTISISRGKTRVGTVHVDIEEPKMDYIVLRQNGGCKWWYSNGEVITVDPLNNVEIVDVKTNIFGNVGVKIYLYEDIGEKDEKRARAVDLGGEIPIDYFTRTNSMEHQLVVKREGIELGRTIIKVSEPITSAMIK